MATGKRTKRREGGKKAPTRKRVARKATGQKVAGKSPARRSAAKKPVARKKQGTKTATRKKVITQTVTKKPPSSRKAAKKKLGTSKPAATRATQAALKSSLKKVKGLEEKLSDLEAQLIRSELKRKRAEAEYDEALVRIEELQSAAGAGAPPHAPPASAAQLATPGSAEPYGSTADDSLDVLVDDPTFEAPATEPEVPLVQEDELEYEDYDEDEDFLSPMSGSAERRRELDRDRSDRELELGDEEYWWVCSKCGEPLVEHEFDNIKVERCESCGAVTIDKGEVELLLASEDGRMVTYRVRGLFQ